MSPRLFVGLLFAGFSIFLVSAKCIENDTVRRGIASDWTVFGEIHNETDVQGVEILLRGTLFNEAGDVVGVAQAQTCPSELSPGSLSVFAIRFNNSQAVGQPARHQVNVLSGKTLEEPLPFLDVTIGDVFAGVENGTNLSYRFSVTPDQEYAGDLIACIAWYDAAGEVVFVDILSVGAAPQPGVPRDFNETAHDYRPLFGEVASARLFVWIDNPDTAVLDSLYQAVVTDHIPVQH